MPKGLREEIKQTKPFATLEQEALLSVARTAALLSYSLAEYLKDFGLTGTQYNVLRILRGSEPGGLCRHEVKARLVAPGPDVTRLLDRLEEAGLITRERSDDDRRLVRTRITREGLQMLARLDEPVAEMERQSLGHMSKNELRELIDLLARAREKV